MRVLATTLAFAIVGTAAFAQNAPKALYNKSIIMSFGIAQALKAPDGRVINPGFSREMIIYVSSAGRLFNRSTGHSAGGSRIVQTTHRGPDEAAPGGGGWQFQGNQMVGGRALVSGATRSMVTFDASFSSCNLIVIFGKEEGKALKTRGIDGVEYEVISMSAVHPSCKIQDGNVFAK